MQTTQVNGPANLLAGGKQPGKQVDNDPAQGFDQALSREVAGRREGDASSAGNRSEQTQSQTATPAASSESKTTARTSEGEKTEEDSPDTTAGAGDAATQFSTDMLALVAAINSITGQNNVRPELATGNGASADVGGVGGKAQMDLAAALRTPVEAADTDGDVTAAAGATGATGVTDAAAEIAAAGTRGEGGAEFLEALQDSAARAAAAPAIAPQAALQAARQSQAAPVADRLTPAVGTPAWDQALGQKVVWMVAGEQQSASLTLNPPDLGPLQVVLNVSNSQATATFTAAQPEVRQALEAALPKLRDMLGEAGIQLGQASVNSGSPNQQGNTGEPGAHGRASGALAGVNGSDSTGAGATGAGGSVATSANIGLVDTFA